MFRQIQCIEERCKDKFAASTSSSQPFDTHIMLGTSSRSALCICPKLSDFLADETRKTTAVNKELRKAREERALLKPEKGGKKEGG